MKKYLAEFLGTFGIVLFGTGAIVVNEQYGGIITHIGIAFAFGFVVFAMINMFADVSAHFNPAVSIALCIDGNLSIVQLFPYIFSQVLGAFAGTGALVILFNNTQNYGATLPAAGEFQAFVIEIILTFFLMLGVLRVANKPNESTSQIAFVIGMIVFLEALVAGPLSGASMNPARSLAPAIVSGKWGTLWIYLIAPTLGAVMAVYCNRFFSENQK